MIFRDEDTLSIVYELQLIFGSQLMEVGGVGRSMQALEELLSPSVNHEFETDRLQLHRRRYSQRLRM